MIKAACHIHSDWSYDGEWPLEKLAAGFSQRGYRVLMMTEHDRGFTEGRLLQYREACAQASLPDLLVIPGIEYSDSTNTVHVLVWGSVPFLGEGLPTGELLQKVQAAGGLAVFAHPSRKGAWSKFDIAWIPHLLGVEVWNRKTDGWAPSRTAPALMAGTPLLPFVGLDFHNRRQFFSMAMALMLGSTTSEEGVLGCFRAGRCRAFAFGAAIDWTLSGGQSTSLRLAETCRRALASMYRGARAGR